MNRKIFIERLRELLKDIPSDEREEALAYYESYFDEAGTDREEEVIRELESPEKVASTIKKDLFETVEGNPNAPVIYEANEHTADSGRMDDKDTKRREKGSDKAGKIILVIVLVVLTFPIWISVLATFFGVLVGIFGILFGITVGMAAAMGGVLISGFVLICIGIANCIAGNVAVGIFVMGIGMLLCALGILILVGMVWICAKLIPLLCRGIVNLWNRIFHRRKERVE